MASALHLLLLVSIGLLAASVEAQDGGCPNACPPMWTQCGRRCFRFSDVLLNWFNAEKICIRDGGHLVSLRSDYEYAFVKKMLLKNAPEKCVWVGGTDTVEEGAWQWSDGAKFEFNGWSSGQPDDFFSSEHCMDVKFGATDVVSDSPCATLRPFVCAKDL